MRDSERIKDRGEEGEKRGKWREKSRWGGKERLRETETEEKSTQTFF